MELHSIPWKALARKMLIYINLLELLAELEL